ncbi:MAG: glycerophosphodiester phosphodiesterase family protein [Patescibacteria group bacterium]
MSRSRKSSFPILENGGYPSAFAHRGGNAVGAKRENSLAAMWEAYLLGYRRVETDAVASADGKVMAVHGSAHRLEQLYRGLPPRSILESMDYADIKRKYRIGGEEIPLLGDVFDEFPEDLFLNIDPKRSAVIKPLGKLLLDRKFQDRVCIGSRLYSRTQGVAEILGGQARVCTATGWLGLAALKLNALGQLQKSEAACIQAPYELVGAATVERAHDLGFDIHAWTVNDRNAMNKTLDLGVDGIMTDNVVALRAVMRSRGDWPQVA